MMSRCLVILPMPLLFRPEPFPGAKGAIRIHGDDRADGVLQMGNASRYRESHTIGICAQFAGAAIVLEYDIDIGDVPPVGSDHEYPDALEVLCGIGPFPLHQFKGRPQVGLARFGNVLLGEPGRQTGDLFIEWIASRGWWLERFEEPVPTRDKPIRIFLLTRR